MNRGLLLAAFEGAISIEFCDGTLNVVFNEDDVFAKRRDASAAAYIRLLPSNG